MALENALSQAILARFRDFESRRSRGHREDTLPPSPPSLALAFQFVSFFLRLQNFPLPRISLERSPFSAAEKEEQDYDAFLVPYALAEQIIRQLISRVIILCSENWLGRANAPDITLSAGGTARESIHWASFLVVWARMLPSHWISSISASSNMEEAVDAALNRFQRTQRGYSGNDVSVDSAQHAVVGLQTALILLFAGFEQGDGTAITAATAQVELLRLQRGNGEENKTASLSSPRSELEPGESLLFRVATGGIEGPTQQHKEARLRTVLAAPPWYASVAVRTLRTVHEYLTKVLLRAEKDEKWESATTRGPLGGAAGLTLRQKAFLYDPTSEEEKVILEKLPVSLCEARRATKELRSRANIALLGKRVADKVGGP